MCTKQGEERRHHDVQSMVVWHKGRQRLVAHVMHDKYQPKKNMIGSKFGVSIQCRNQAWGRKLSSIWQAIGGNEKQPTLPRLRSSDYAHYSNIPIDQPWKEKEKKVHHESYSPRRPSPMDLWGGTFSVEMKILASCSMKVNPSNSYFQHSLLRGCYKVWAC